MSATLHELLDPATVNDCRHGCLLRLLQRRAEAKAINSRDHLLDGDLGGVEGHYRLLSLEAYVCTIHALQPFQGLLDRDGSGTSRHAVHREHDRRRRGQRDVPDKEQAEEQGED